MTPPDGQPHPVTVVVPAGLPLLDAARWVGESCWSELHAFELITEGLKADDLTDSQRVALWRVRSNRAEVAEAWHHRLPELREFPRESFVARPDEIPGAAAVPREVSVTLEDLRRRYSDHSTVAVGPADGPVAHTLSWALDLLVQDLAALERWVPPGR